MKNIFIEKELTVESKFDRSELSPNQRAARSNVTTPGGLLVDRTTSTQLGTFAQGVATGSSGQVKRD